MAIAAKISSAELTAQVSSRFDGAFLEARLINAPGTAYTPGTTDDPSFLTFEVTPGTSGYERQVIYYNTGSISGYSDAGVALDTRATVFAHDGSGSPIDFSHVALVWSTGNVATVSDALVAPSAAVNGSYTNIPIDSTDGSGAGMTVDLSVINAGASTTDYAITVASAGRGYANAEVLTILEGTLAGLGIVSAGAGNLTFSVSGVSTQANADQVLAVAQTSAAVSLSGGNEAAFYWNLKQFGFYSVA